MAILPEIVTNAINEACKMPEGLLRKPGAGSSLAIITTVHKCYCSKQIYKRDNTVFVNSK
jgi:hypothetical protein